ncbi:MAG: hypothetical protein COA49_04050 [Bacteroidetes bacterium]|nr:MAG: hypothetical protein COA49_04050 [Bacteroidota bacterium]
MNYLNLILILLVLASCNKGTSETCNDGLKNQDEVEIDCGGTCVACAIEYPEIGAYGTNILFGVDTLILNEENSSMRATILEGSSLKIELMLISGEVWFYENEQNCTVSSFYDNRQTFTNLNNGTLDIELHNANTLNIDTILIRYFENGNNETMRKVLIRE